MAGDAVPQCAIHGGRLEEKLKLYTAPRLMIIDEIGYLPIDRVGIRNAELAHNLAAGWQDGKPNADATADECKLTPTSNCVRSNLVSYELVDDAAPMAVSLAAVARPAEAGTTMTFTIPIQVTVSIGAPAGEIAAIVAEAGVPTMSGR